MNYLIDTSGRWWRWPSQLLSERLGYPDPDFDLAAYAARNLGYVWLEVREDVTLLQFRAGMLTPQTLDILRPYLQKAIRERPVGLVYFASGWIEEAFIDAAPLLARIDALAGLREPRMRDLFIRKQHNLSHWSRQEENPLSSLFDVWRFTDGNFSEPARRFLDSSGLGSRTVHIEDGGDGSLYVGDSGPGFTVYDGFSFHAGRRRRRIEDQPDKAYGQWVRKAYQLTLDTGLPQADDIDVIVEEPGHDPRRRRYQRIILKWKLPGGGVLLTGSSLINQNISIPINIGS